MIRAFVVTVSMSFASLLCSQLVVAEDDVGVSVANDPRVMDAVSAWAVWVEYQLAINSVPGASVGIVHDQDVLLAAGFGLANPATGRPATSDTIYSICSNSKLFTSIGVMQLRDDGSVTRFKQHSNWYLRVR